ncbi:MAG: hypothetical protein RLO17_13720 [Cyclobacteriaceae bacterium]
MKKNILYLLLAVLAGVIIHQVIFQRSMITETLHTTRKMDQQLDSLWSIFQQYEHTRTEYETAYEQLMLAQQELIAIRKDFTSVSEEQQADVLSIRQQLQQLMRSKRELPLSLPQSLGSESVDSLLFQP